MINTLSTVTLDPTGGNHPQIIRDVTQAIIISNGKEIPLDLGGYLDIGLLDTMMDLFVNFLGAVIFSVVGYFYVKSRGSGRFARRFIPQILDHQDSRKNTSDDV